MTPNTHSTKPTGESLQSKRKPSLAEYARSWDKWAEQRKQEVLAKRKSQS